WVPVPALYAAMEASDEATARPRGWIALRRSGRPASLLFTARCVGERGFAAFAESLARLGAALAAGPAVDLQAVLRGMFEAIAAELPVVIEHRALAQSDHVAAAEALLFALRETPVFRAVAQAVPPGWPPEAATL